MQRLDSNAIPDRPGEHRLFAVVRNEALRLPFWISYHRKLGVDRFFVIDNDSTDGTRDLLLSHPTVHCFRTSASYTQHWSWIQSLLERYGIGNWCLILDADEILCYPYCERVNLRNLTDVLEEERANAMHFMMLDMYSASSLDETVYHAGSDPRLTAPYFDRDTHYLRGTHYFGGMRERVFGSSPCLTKYPLIRFHPGMQIDQGTHSLENATISPMRGVLLHFKYFQDFRPRVREEVRREEHWKNATQYKEYDRRTRNGDLAIHQPCSGRYTTSQDLLRHGLMAASDALRARARSVRRR